MWIKKHDKYVLGFFCKYDADEIAEHMRELGYLMETVTETRDGYDMHFVKTREKNDANDG